MNSTRSKADRQPATPASSQVECLYECTRRDDPTQSTYAVRIAHSGQRPETISTAHSTCVLRSCRVVSHDFSEDPF